MASSDGETWLTCPFEKVIQHWLFLQYEILSGTILCIDVGLDLQMHCLSLHNLVAKLSLARRV
jgi:hypothetical protein